MQCKVGKTKVVSTISAFKQGCQSSRIKFVCFVTNKETCFSMYMYKNVFQQACCVLIKNLKFLRKYQVNCSDKKQKLQSGGTKGWTISDENFYFFWYIFDKTKLVQKGHDTIVFLWKIILQQHHASYFPLSQLSTIYSHPLRKKTNRHTNKLP